MSDLLDRVKVSNLVNGSSIPDVYKNNSIYLYNSLLSSNENYKLVGLNNIVVGRFYFVHYDDPSNWIRLSPIFTCDFRKISNKFILFGVNFNFIPLEIRVILFDKFIKDDDMDLNRVLTVNYEGMYKELIRYGFEYSIVEYDMSKIKIVHEVNLSCLPRFLYSGHPVNKYDPKKLYEIWSAKIKGKSDRNSEIQKLSLDEVFSFSSDLKRNYDQLKGHIDRLKKRL